MKQNKTKLDLNDLKNEALSLQPRLKQYALYLTRSSQEAEDLVQETFAQFLARPEAYDGRTALATWLHRIMQYQHYNRMRKHSNREEAEDPTLGMFDTNGMWKESAPEGVPGFVYAFESREVLEKVNESLDELTEVQKSAFYLKYVEDLDNSEIAEILDVTEGNLRIILHRARFALRNKMTGIYNEKLFEYHRAI